MAETAVPSYGPAPVPTNIARAPTGVIMAPVPANQPMIVGPTFTQPPPQPNVAVVVGQPVTTQVTQIRTGTCARCGGYVENTYTLFGILCAILCFPLGLIFLFCMQDRQCTSCGLTY